MRPNLPVIVGNRAGGPQQIEIVDDPSPQFSTEDAGDGGIVITIDTGEAPKKQPRSNAFDANLADGMDDMALNALASHLLDGIEADLQSRKEWEETANLTAAFLGIKLQDPTTSVSADGTICKEVSTAMLEAAAKLWGTARAELLPVGGPVKVRRDTGPNPLGQAQTGEDQQQDDLADALEKDMNHYLTVGDREYYPDFSKMLFHRALIGNQFRKVYRCPLKRKPVSVWVKAQDLIVSNDCSHLSGAGRVTERIRYRQATMRRLQVSGHYLDVPLAQPTGTATDTEISVAETEGIVATPMLPEDFEHKVYECYCEIGSGTASSLIGDLSDLENDENGKKVGYPLPYRVSIDEDSRKILEIRRNWKQGDENYRPRRRYVKYGFIPGFGFYDLGLIHLVGNPTQVATMIQRSCVDNALLNNFPAFIGKKGPGTRLNENTVLRPGPGQVMTFDAAGPDKISDVLMPMPYHPPSAEAMQLGLKVEGDIKRMAGVIEIPVGEGRIGNTPVGTIMSYIESISMVPGAVHKDDHISQQDEFEMLRELLAEEPQILWQGNRTPARRWQVAEELLQPDLVPAADPNTPSMIHRLMKTQGLVTVGGLPQFMGIADNRQIYRDVVHVLTGEVGGFELPEQPAQPPPPDPKIVAAQIKAQADTAKVQASMAKDQAQHNERMAQINAEGDQREADRQSAETRAAMSLEAARVKAEADTTRANHDRLHDAFTEAADRAHERHQSSADRAQQASEGAANRAHQAQEGSADRFANQFSAPFGDEGKGE